MVSICFEKFIKMSLHIIRWLTYRKWHKSTVGVNHDTCVINTGTLEMSGDYADMIIKGHITCDLCRHYLSSSVSQYITLASFNYKQVSWTDR